jgi:hypothetical protein
VQGADGLVIDTPEFALKKGDKVTVRVTLVPNVVAKTPDPPKVALPEPRAERKAAEYVLSIGGVVFLNEEGREVKSAKDLPGDPFQLTGFMLDDNKQVTDAGLAVFKDCRHLRRIHLCRTAVTDAGLGHFKECKNLVVLHIWSTKVGDAGLVNFKGCKDLVDLGLFDTPVSDAGLAHFAECKKLGWLSVAGCPNITDAGLVNFKGCTNLVCLYLDSSPVGDAGLAHFAECRELQLLWLSATRITDQGLAQVKGYKKLNSLNLFTTQVSPTKVVELAKALPQCQIMGKESNGEPRK